MGQRQVHGMHSGRGQHPLLANRLTLDDRAIESDKTVPSEWWLAEEQLIEQDAESPEIDSVGMATFTNHLGRQVVRGADNAVCALAIEPAGRRAECESGLSGGHRYCM